MRRLFLAALLLIPTLALAGELENKIQVLELRKQNIQLQLRVAQYQAQEMLAEIEAQIAELQKKEQEEKAQ